MDTNLASKNEGPPLFIPAGPSGSISCLRGTKEKRTNMLDMTVGELLGHICRILGHGIVIAVCVSAIVLVFQVTSKPMRRFVAAVWGFVKPRLPKNRRSAFLDSLEKMEMTEVVRIAKEIGILGEDGEFLWLLLERVKGRFTVASLGKLVGSLLHKFPTLGNYFSVVEFLINTSLNYQEDFLTAAGKKHYNVAEKLRDMRRETWEKDRKEREEQRNKRAFECGLKACKK